jgi:hypothetical protein
MITGHKELAWAAGFLEGEGTFHVQGRSRKTTGYNGVPSISAVQVQKWPVERLQEILGGRIYHCAKVQDRWSSKRQPYWKWTMAGRAAAGVMLTIYPYLSPKRQQQCDAVFRIPRKYGFNGRQGSEFY